MNGVESETPDSNVIYISKTEAFRNSTNRGLIRMISDEEIKARDCLRSGSYLLDPKYMPAEAKGEEKLRERCKACWEMRAYFPSWVTAYIEKWKKEKAA